MLSSAFPHGSAMSREAAVRCSVSEFVCYNSDTASRPSLLSARVGVALRVSLTELAEVSCLRSNTDVTGVCVAVLLELSELAEPVEMPRLRSNTDITGVCVAVLLELSELAEPVEMPRLCCNTDITCSHHLLTVVQLSTAICCFLATASSVCPQADPPTHTCARQLSSLLSRGGGGAVERRVAGAGDRRGGVRLTARALGRRGSFHGAGAAVVEVLSLIHISEPTRPY